MPVAQRANEDREPEQTPGWRDRMHRRSARGQSENLASAGAPDPGAPRIAMRHEQHRDRSTPRSILYPGFRRWVALVQLEPGSWPSRGTGALARHVPLENNAQSSDGSSLIDWRARVNQAKQR